MVMLLLFEWLLLSFGRLDGCLLFLFRSCHLYMLLLCLVTRFKPKKKTLANELCCLKQYKLNIYATITTSGQQCDTTLGVKQNYSDKDNKESATTTATAKTASAAKTRQDKDLF